MIRTSSDKPGIEGHSHWIETSYLRGFASGKAFAKFRCLDNALVIVVIITESSRVDTSIFPTEGSVDKLISHIPSGCNLTLLIVGIDGYTTQPCSFSVLSEKSHHLKIQLEILVPLNAPLDTIIFPVAENGCRYGSFDLATLAQVGKVPDISNNAKYSYLIGTLRRITTLKFNKHTSLLRQLTGGFRSSFDICGIDPPDIPTLAVEWVDPQIDIEGPAMDSDDEEEWNGDDGE